MKKFLILFILTILVFCSNNQNKKTIFLSKDSSEIVTTISRIENGLLTAVAIEGESNNAYSLRERMHYFDVPGLSIAVIKNNCIQWAKSYGVKEKGTDDAVTLNTLFQAASLSKPVTALTVLKLENQGKIDLKRDINQQLKTWQVPENEFTQEKAVTPELLILHLSGLNIPAYPGYSSSGSLPGILDILNGSGSANTEPTRVGIVPGTEWRYSGAGYTVLQLLIQEVTGNTFDLAMKDLLLNPLGLKNSTFSTSLSPLEQKMTAKAYKEDGALVKGGYHIYPESAAAGLWTTPIEYAKIIIDLQKTYFGKSEKVLTQKAAHSILTKYWRDMGFGFLLRNEGEKMAIAFSGGNEGYICDIFSYLHLGTGVVIMTNSNNGSPLIEEIYRSLSKEYSWPDFKQKNLKTIDVPASSITRLPGIYKGNSRDNVEFTFKIIVKNNFFYTIIANKTYKLFPIDMKEFVIPEQDWRISINETKDKIDSVNYRLQYGKGVANRLKDQ